MAELIVKGVKCDSCDWHDETETDIRRWHKVQCPKCNDCVIITDEDLAALELMEAMCQVATVLEGALPEEKRKGPMGRLVMDTAPMREGKPISLHMEEESRG